MLVHPVIAESYATALDDAASGDSLDPDLPSAALESADLLQRFAVVSDGRSDQGRDHPVAVVLTLCAAAVLAGMRSFTAIAGWVADVPTELLTQGEQRREPAESALVAVAVDGKTVRGSIDSEGNQVHLLAAATYGEQLVLGQVEVGAKSNEIPMFAPLLEGLIATGVNLRGLVITADALHSQRAHAEYLHSIGAEFVLTVKGNQPRLFAALDALPWAQTPIAARDIDTSHGRVTTRTIQVLPAPAELPFSHVNQVWLIERYVTDPDGTPRSAVAALGVTSLPTARATPTDIATLVREHWGIESLHWLRDTVYREDNSTARTGSGPRVMAALRNLAIGALHLLGRRDITEATRWATRAMDRPFKILKLAS